MAGDLAAELEALADARERGEIDEATFQERKAALLADGSPEQQPAPPRPALEDARPLAWGTPPASGQTPTVVWHEPTPPPPPAPHYPVRFEIDYPERLSRWKTLLRGFLFIPVAFFLELLQQMLGALVAVGWTAVFWRKKYPSWAFAGASGTLGFFARATAYGLLQTDRFPSFDRESSPVALEFDPPPSGLLSRWRVFFWKLTLLVPHFIVLGFLWFALSVVTLIAWFAILITGRYPRGLFPFATGVLRWQYRVTAYFLSFNDRFPPYSLSAAAGPARKGATVSSGIIGFLVGGGFTALIVVAAVLGSRPIHEDADYAALTRGRGAISNEHTASDGGTVRLTLQRIYDPGEEMVKIIRPGGDERVIVVEWAVRNSSSNAASIAGDSAWLTVDDGGKETDHDAVLVTVEDRGAPISVAAYDSAIVRAVFVVPKSATPTKLRFHNGFAGVGGVEYRFR